MAALKYTQKTKLYKKYLHFQQQIKLQGEKALKYMYINV